MKKRKENQHARETMYPLAGWILFVICAILFMASSLKNHDMLAFMGSAVFLIACFVFLIPIFKNLKTTDDTKPEDDKQVI